MNITQARTVFFQQGTSRKFLGYLVRFEDDDAAEEFCKKEDKKFKDKELRCLKISDIVLRNQMYRNKANFDNNVEYTEPEAEKRIVLMRVNEPDVSTADTKIRETFEKIVDVYRSGGDQGIAEHITIVTFASADYALRVPMESY